MARIFVEVVFTKFAFVITTLGDVIDNIFALDINAVLDVRLVATIFVDVVLTRLAFVIKTLGEVIVSKLALELSKFVILDD